ncbi:MAG: phage late control D family protein [Deltaproteobacteria bacterium]|nr:phage late control D family protein [Deltaproteobacteria bacterium]
MGESAHPGIRLAGRLIDREEIAALAVHQDVDQPDRCQVMLRNLGAPLRATTVLAGDELVVELGFEGAPQATVFTGEVVGLQTTYDTSGRSTVTLHGFSRLHRLTRGRKSRTFENLTDQEIAAKIAEDAHLTASVDGDSQIRYPHVHQHNQTDLEFLRDRASRIGYELGLRDGKTLVFQRRDLASDSGLTLALGRRQAGLELQRFAPKLSLAQRISEVHVRGWDPVKRQEIVGKARSLRKTLATESGLDAGKDVFGHTIQYETDDKVTAQDQADARARALLERAALQTITGLAVATGNPALKPSLVVTIDLGADTRFSGQYYLAGAVHRWSASAGYLTELRVQRNGLGAARPAPRPGAGAVAPEERAATRAAARIALEARQPASALAEAAPRPPARSSFLEIELVGEDGSPIPGERYRVDVDGGPSHQGVTDDQGKARIEPLDAGKRCTVSFPALDADAWESA